MKRALVASILGIAVSGVSSYGDGYVIFSNYNNVPSNPVVYGVGVIGQTAGTYIDDPTVEVQLYYAIGTYTNTSSFLSVATAGNTTFINPTFGAGYYYDSIKVPEGYEAIVQVLVGWNGLVNAVYTVGSNPVTFMVEGWETTGPQGGATYSEALVSGQTSLWTEVAGVYNNDSIGILPSAADAATSELGNGPPELTISAVPEPATMTLLGLATVPFYFIRKWKK
jgi:hypothetical protein